MLLMFTSMLKRGQYIKLFMVTLMLKKGGVSQKIMLPMFRSILKMRGVGRECHSKRCSSRSRECWKIGDCHNKYNAIHVDNNTETLGGGGGGVTANNAPHVHVNAEKWWSVTVNNAPHAHVIAVKGGSVTVNNAPHVHVNFWKMVECHSK